MNLILERTSAVPYFTNMKLFFSALGIAASDYDWYLSDVETNFLSRDFTNQDQWIEGCTLERLIDQNEIQFIWAVFSAVPKGIRFVVGSPPDAQTTDYWCGVEAAPQLNGALFEIVARDSNATILIGFPAEATERFKQRYPEARSLSSTAN